MAFCTYHIEYVYLQQSVKQTSFVPLYYNPWETLKCHTHLILRMSQMTQKVIDRMQFPAVVKLIITHFLLAQIQNHQLAREKARRSFTYGLLVVNLALNIMCYLNITRNSAWCFAPMWINGRTCTTNVLNILISYIIGVLRASYTRLRYVLNTTQSIV